jgi:diguanylate cyclase (GGDEF)-like protein
VEHAVALARRAQRLLGVLFVDLDRFKIINDSLGHATGDGLLRTVGERIRDCVRRTDLVARLGGDEFVVLLEELRHQEDAAITAQKIIAVLQLPFVVNDIEMQVSASVGIALYPHDAETMSDLLKNADAAMYRAKENGRNGFQFYTPDMHQRSQRRMWLENEMRHALAREEMRVVFEPQVRIDRRQLRAVEALLRWDHGSDGVIMPTEFIPVAEEIGLVTELGGWVMQAACQHFRRAIDNGLDADLLAVNVSPLQLRDGHLQEAVMAALSAARLRPDQLEIEVTESALLSDQGKSAEVLRSLSALGVRIALDDFGTGYSSLTNLQLFPVSTVKIDRSFIRDIERDSNDAGLVRAVLGMANVLGLDVVAEGVESAQQQDLLREWGCACMQGHLFGGSVSGEALGPIDLSLQLSN